MSYPAIGSPGLDKTDLVDDPIAAAPALPPTCLIEARGLRKKYCRDFRRSLLYGLQDVASTLLLRSPHSEKLRPHEFWAIDQVCFELRRGDSLGLMGHNGAGKSTLLKLITGQRSLTAGQVITRGRIIALNELGLGFDPALTGRENAYMNAAVLGLPRRRLDPLIEDIISFAGLRNCIDAAVQTYSSGMKARLGFAVAAHLEPDILIVDEVLAVGDLPFRRKCVQHVLNYLRRGGSLVLVAHDPYLIQSICNRCIVLNGGRVIYDGDAVEGVRLYLDLGRTAAPTTHEPSQMPPPPPPVSSEVAEEYSVVIDSLDIFSEARSSLVTGGAARIRLRCRSFVTSRVGWGFMIRTKNLQTNISSLALGLEGESVAIRPGENVFECRIPHLPLHPGEYAICAGVSDAATGVAIALLGYDNAPIYFCVRGGVGARRANWQASLESLVEIPVEWIDPSQPLPQKSEVE